ncbi:adenosyl-hopene transferase HpnH [Sphingomonas paeninsulae]|jgi:hopanoid biosynthesis associated radical SAM protein HpnH|uniref:Adenosyl-hopene transferase HpnH n=1 Tax=Sphingomonas paeninsulae TaxID=2319844 RepID=A0A494TM11_SPHPE|nr:adenosyl-hopene transferase HpnH [Sphingomonas paeninsulae]AYJ86841.1 adenosyl-hopene transferase HpnH [Sphingomonas paeninsulae]
MSLPLSQLFRLGSYAVKQHFKGGKYPLVLMLEPLFRCNLACAGCGKIDYPDPILNQRLSYDQCMEAIDECGAPAVSIAGGEPLLHKDMPRIVEGFLKKKKFVILCTNALLMKKKIDDYKPDPGFTWSIHLDGDKGMHDHAVCQDGVYDVAYEAIELAKAKGFRVQVNCTVFEGASSERLAGFFDTMQEMGVEITISPGYAYERAADQDHFLNRQKTRQFFRDVFKRGDGGKAWTFTNSPLFLDFLAGNQTYECTPWSMPLRTVFGWQKPCYLIGEGYVSSFKELMEGTEWDKYGVGKYEKCADCMVHCGFEGTAATDALRHPLKILSVGRKGIRTDGPMAPDIDLSHQRPTEDVHSSHVERELAKIKLANPTASKHVVAAL